jgi:membrane protein involved in colicin uptake
MYTKISNEIIRQFQPCYDPSKVITDETEELTVTEWIKKYRNVVPAKDILWLLLRKEFLSEKDLRLFAVWCAREALKLVENPDKRSIEACNVAERYANGEATKEEIWAANDAAHDVADAAYLAVYAALAAANTDYAAFNIGGYTVDYLVNDAAYDAAYAAAYAASDAASDAEYADSTAANTAAAHAALAAAISARAAAHDSDTVSCDDAAHAAQLDQLLTYFE